jgi:hypothetical protein
MMVEHAPQLVPEARPICLVSDPRLRRLERFESALGVRRQITEVIEQSRPPRCTEANVREQALADGGGSPPNHPPGHGLDFVDSKVPPARHRRRV